MSPGYRARSSRLGGGYDVRGIHTAYVTVGDARDVRTWSGTFFYAARALAEQGFAVDPIGPLHTRYEHLAKAKEASVRLAMRRRHPRDRDPGVARRYARQVESRLRADHELVFAVGTLALPFLECPQPIVVWSDATFAGLLDFYPMYSNLSARAKRNGHALERAALERSVLAIYSSDWAAESAVRDYGIDPARVAVVPYGANLDTELSRDEAMAAIDARGSAVCRLLFIGAEWERKGGPLTLEIVRRLRQAGIRTELALVGSRPSAGELPESVTALGFIDKATADGRKRMQELLLETHFLVLPARADCTPIVLCEAAAHAVPVVAADVGGIPSLVREGANGYLIQREAASDAYAETIVAAFADCEGYRTLALSSLDEYRERLNWRVAGKAVRALVEERLAARSLARPGNAVDDD